MSKRIVLLSMGTTGDITPHVSLGITLKQRGHSVLIGGPSDFREMVEAAGLEFLDLGISFKNYITSTQVESLMSRNAILELPGLAKQALEMTELAAHRAWKACQNADLITFNLYTSFAIDIAEALNIPIMAVTFQPLLATSEFSLCINGGQNYGSFLNRKSYLQMEFHQFLANIPRQKFRKAIGLGKLEHGRFMQDNRGNHIPTLGGYSQVLSPQPKDWAQNDFVTGYWRQPDTSGWQPSPELQKFLAEGDAPIYIGFGSIPFGAERNTRILKEALKIWGGRAILARGWGGIIGNDFGDNVFVIDKAPHDILFQHVKAVVHHGGAGTTNSGLRLGLPTLIMPITVDQPYWGRRVHEFGCGPAPRRMQKTDAKTLAAILKDLSSNESYKHAAMNLAKKLNQETGCEKAAEVIEEVLKSSVHHSKAS